MSVYPKINYMDGSGEPLDADNLNHSEDWIAKGNLRTGANWKGIVYLSAGVQVTDSAAYFDGTRTSRTYWDGGADAMFNGAGYYYLKIPAGVTVVGITADVKFASASTGGYLKITHTRVNTTTVIGSDAEDGTCYGLSTGAYYPVEEGDTIQILVTGLTANASSAEVEMSALIL